MREQAPRLTTCEECGRIILMEALTCPHCKIQIYKTVQRQSRTRIGLVVVILLLALVVFALSG